MIRNSLREYLARDDGALQIPRLLGIVPQGENLVDIAEGRASYDPSELPKIHVLVGNEISFEDTNDLDRQLKTAPLTISVYVNKIDKLWRPYNSYYSADFPLQRNYGPYYSEGTKGQLRTNLEEISLELSYRIRRSAPVDHVRGLLSLFELSINYAIDERGSEVQGILTHNYEIKYYQ